MGERERQAQSSVNDNGGSGLNDMFMFNSSFKIKNNGGSLAVEWVG